MPGGRPTVATPEMVLRAYQYLESVEQSSRIPTVEGMAYTLDISKDTLYERKEFSDVLRKVKLLQADRLITNGLDGTYNPSITKLLLSSKHGYVEKSDVTSGGRSLVEHPLLGNQEVHVPSDDGDEEDNKPRETS